MVRKDDDVVCWSALVGSCGRQGAWRAALRVFAAMPARNAVSFVCAARAAPWGLALALSARAADEGLLSEARAPPSAPRRAAGPRRGRLASGAGCFAVALTSPASSWPLRVLA